MEIEINKHNCYNLYFDDLGNISYTRLIENKLYNYKVSDASEGGVLESLSSLTQMDNEQFILICSLLKSINGEVSN